MNTEKLSLLARAMQAYTWRMQSLSGNVANLDTEGYERRSVAFESELQQARNSILGDHAMAKVSPRIIVGDGPPQLENELIEIADTQMRTQLSARALRDHFNLVNMAITGRTS